MSDILNEVVVIGAGPAGVQAALTLNRWGLSVTIVDKDFLNECLPLFHEDQLPFLNIAKSNISELRNKNIKQITGNVNSVIECDNCYVIEINNHYIETDQIILATGNPGNENISYLDTLEDLQFDKDNRIITDENYGTQYKGLYAVGEAASGYVRTLACALGTGDGVARMIGRNAFKIVKAA